MKHCWERKPDPEGDAEFRAKHGCLPVAGRLCLNDAILILRESDGEERPMCRSCAEDFVARLTGSVYWDHEARLIAEFLAKSDDDPDL